MTRKWMTVIRFLASDSTNKGLFSLILSHPLLNISTNLRRKTICNLQQSKVICRLKTINSWHLLVHSFHVFWLTVSLGVHLSTHGSFWNSHVCAYRLIWNVVLKIEKYLEHKPICVLQYGVYLHTSIWNAFFSTLDIRGFISMPTAASIYRLHLQPWGWRQYISALRRSSAYKSTWSYNAVNQHRHIYYKQYILVSILNVILFNKRKIFLNFVGRITFRDHKMRSHSSRISFLVQKSTP